MRNWAGRLFSWASPLISTYGYQTLFMPIRADAVRAALASVSDRPLLKASISTGLRAAKAADRAAPTPASPYRGERAIPPYRFRLLSISHTDHLSLIA